MCVQTHASLRKLSQMTDSKPQDAAFSIIQQSTSRIGPPRQFALAMLKSSTACTMSNIAMMTIMCAGGSVESILPIDDIMTSGRSQDVFLVAHPDDPIKPMTPNSIKRQLVKALSLISAQAEAYKSSLCCMQPTESMSTSSSTSRWVMKLNDPFCCLHMASAFKGCGLRLLSPSWMLC